MKEIDNNNICYARGCDHNNIDCTCMYGDASKMRCQVNCYNCIKRCKKTKGDISCKRFKNKHSNRQIMKNPCVKCLNQWLCSPYGGSCFKSKLFWWFRKLKFKR
jgi:hypothetical protein